MGDGARGVLAAQGEVAARLVRSDQGPGVGTAAAAGVRRMPVVVALVLVLVIMLAVAMLIAHLKLNVEGREVRVRTHPPSVHAAKCANLCCRFLPTNPLPALSCTHAQNTRT